MPRAGGGKDFSSPCSKWAWRLLLVGVEVALAGWRPVGTRHVSSKAGGNYSQEPVVIGAMGLGAGQCPLPQAWQSHRGTSLMSYRGIIMAAR